MIHILIVEDDENITKMLKATLAIGGYAYDAVADGDSAVETILAGNYDVVLLDVMLPGRDGFAVLESVRAAGSAVSVIFLTALGAVADKVRGLRGGAEDYVVKPFEAVELLARIEVVLRRAGKGETHLSYGDVRIDIDRHTVEKAGAPVLLTPKEFDVLVFFMQHLDVAVTRDQLLSNVWGYEFAGESRTVDIHVQQVRRKLGLQGQLITIPKLGYRLEKRPGNG